MQDPHFTIIVPTINRPDTLYYTLRTVLNNQSYSNYSVIVSDNFSNDNTLEVVNSFNNKRLSYINPGKRLSMSRHWEFALSHVKSGFVTILGDDDGLLPEGLTKVASILKKHVGIRAVGWRFCNFNWAGLPTYFMIPMSNYYRVVNATEEIKAIFQQDIGKTIQFPSLYGGFIDISLINELKQKHGGVFFHSRIPDFFSGAMVAANLQRYIRLEFPITINATSKHSTGYATINKKNDQKAFNDLVKGDDNIPFHEKLVFIRSNLVPITEAMFQVSELVPSFPRVDIKKLITEIIAEIRHTNTREEFEELLQGTLQIAGLNGYTDFAKELLINLKHDPLAPKLIEKFSPISILLYVNSPKANLQHVEDACSFVYQIQPKTFFELKNHSLRSIIGGIQLIRYWYLKYLTYYRKYM